MGWYMAVLKKYAVFSGRARRKEYWMFYLMNLLVACAIAIVETIAGVQSPGPLSIVYSVAIFIPALALAVRRLHDTGRSGWWLLIGLLPIIGAIVLLFMVLQDSQPGENQYGPNPKTVPPA